MIEMEEVAQGGVAEGEGWVIPREFSLVAEDILVPGGREGSEMRSVSPLVALQHERFLEGDVCLQRLKIRIDPPRDGEELLLLLEILGTERALWRGEIRTGQVLQCKRARAAARDDDGLLLGGLFLNAGYETDNKEGSCLGTVDGSEHSQRFIFS